MKVICIGNVTYDITIRFDGFPVENIKYRINERIECGGGPASNACYLLGKWGVNPYFAGIIGNDEYGNKIKREFDSVNVNTKYLEMKNDYNTTSSFIISNKKNGSRTTFAYKPSNFKLNNINDNFDVILIDGQEYQASFDLINNNPNAITIIDAGRSVDDVIKLAKMCKYVVCSKNFAEEVSGIKNNYQLMYEKLEQEFKGIIVVTLESEGSLVRIDGKLVVVPSIKVESTDSTGAGDLYHGAFTYGLIQGWDLLKIVKFSNIVGALSVTKVGSRFSVFPLEEVLKIYNESR